MFIALVSRGKSMDAFVAANPSNACSTLGGVVR